MYNKYVFFYFMYFTTFFSQIQILFKFSFMSGHLIGGQNFTFCLLIRYKTMPELSGSAPFYAHTILHCPAFVAVTLSFVLSFPVSVTYTYIEWQLHSHNEHLPISSFFYSFHVSLHLFNHGTVEDLRVITFSLCRTEYHFFLDVCGGGGSVLLVSASQQHL